MALLAVACILGSIFGASSVTAAPYAAMVIDARTGEVLHARNADTRLHPASLTKMMTLYIAFEAVRLGEISLDTKVRISANAAGEEPSRLGLRAGQRIKLRYLIRAAAVKSANDAATAIGEAISGSEAAFIRRMNRTAKALGMTRTTFKNAHGLTQSGHLSTARDMTTMGRHLLYDYPQYYNLFSRQSTDAGTTTVRNTNRRLLSSYRGADGIKTGYTRAAGFNLVASAERGQERIIATVFGGRSSATRNARVAELLDMGFARAPSRAALQKPQMPRYGSSASGSGRIVLTSSARPIMRPTRTAEPPAELLVAEADPAAEQVTQEAPTRLSLEITTPTETLATRNAPDPAPQTLQVARAPDPVPQPRPVFREEPAPVVVTRSASSGGTGRFGIQLELQASRMAADRLLLRTALQELDTLDSALRKVVESRRGYLPTFEGLSKTEATRACTRLLARQVACAITGS